jgi:hypothetical protein
MQDRFENYNHSFSFVSNDWRTLKKIISIALVLLLLMNTMGYYAIFYGLQMRTDIRVAGQLDNESYDDSRTVTIRYPVSIPYMPDQQQFERVDGKFFHEGRFLRIVKQRYAADTLTIICLIDTESSHIQNALADYVKTYTDNSGSDQNNNKIALSFIKDFISQTFSLGSTTPGWNAEVTSNTLYLGDISSYSSSIIHPPEHC